MTFERFLTTLPSQEARALRRAIDEGDGAWLRDYHHRAMRHAAPVSVPSGRKRAEAPRNFDPYSWMSLDLQKFYRNIDRKHKLDKELANLDPNCLLARKVKIERELELMKQDADHAENWARKKELDKKNAAKDPWAAYRVF